MRLRTLACALTVAALLTGVTTTPAAAQTDFYNLDKNRPLRVEDAYATKRYAFELQMAPLTLAQTGDGTLQYRPEIELKHGLLPGLDVAAGLRLAADRPPPGEPRRAHTQLELTSLLNLTTETRWLPALGVRVTGHVPLEGESASVVEVRGLATRSLFGPVRAHVNGGWTFGEDAHERWWGGVALDYVLPFRHLLLLVETWVAEPGEPETATAQPPPDLPVVIPTQDETSRRVHSTVGLRYQLSPTLAMDAGIGRTLGGMPRQDWLLTFGITYEFAVRALMPVPRRGP
jgi:hypothetical protein